MRKAILAAAVLLLPLPIRAAAPVGPRPLSVEIVCATDGRPQKLLFTDRDGSREESPLSP